MRTALFTLALAAASPAVAGPIIGDAALDDFPDIRGWEVRSADDVPIGRLIYMAKTAEGYLATVLLKPGVNDRLKAVVVPTLHLHDDYLCIEDSYEVIAY